MSRPLHPNDLYRQLRELKDRVSTGSVDAVALDCQYAHYDIFPYEIDDDETSRAVKALRRKLEDTMITINEATRHLDDACAHAALLTDPGLAFPDRP